MLEEGQPGGSRLYLHAFAPRDLKPGVGPQEVHFTLRRGITVKGQVIGPDGQPVAGRLDLQHAPRGTAALAGATWWAQYHGNVHDGRFELHGIDPDAEVPAFFLDAKHNRVPW